MRAVPTLSEGGSAAPSRDRRTLTAYLTPRPPEQQGSQRENYYHYDVTFEGETILTGSRVPECEVARVLLARGITGKLTMLDGKTGSIVGRRWGCTRNISQRAINEYWDAKAREREAAIAARREVA